MVVLNQIHLIPHFVDGAVGSLLDFGNQSRNVFRNVRSVSLQLTAGFFDILLQDDLFVGNRFDLFVRQFDAADDMIDFAQRVADFSVQHFGTDVGAAVHGESVAERKAFRVGVGSVSRSVRQ